MYGLSDCFKLDDMGIMRHGHVKVNVGWLHLLSLASAPISSCASGFGKQICHSKSVRADVDDFEVPLTSGAHV